MLLHNNKKNTNFLIKIVRFFRGITYSYASRYRLGNTLNWDMNLPLPTRGF